MKTFDSLLYWKQDRKLTHAPRSRRPERIFSRWFLKLCRTCPSLAKFLAISNQKSKTWIITPHQLGISYNINFSFWVHLQLSLFLIFWALKNWYFFTLCYFKTFLKRIQFTLWKLTIYPINWNPKKIEKSSLL